MKIFRILLTGSTLALFAHASTLNTGQVGVSPSFSGGTGPFSQNTNNNGPISISGSATGGFASSGSASLMMDYTFIKLQGDAAGALDAITRGIIRNDLLFTAPGVPMGTLGSVMFSIFVDGTMSATSGSSAAGWQLQADLGGGAFDINAGGHQFAPGLGGNYVGDALGYFTGVGSFQFGFIAPLDIELTTSAQAAYDFVGAGAASDDFAHSLYWAGIQGVTVGGVPVTNFTVTSGSGTNYMGSFVPAATPEPSSGVLLAAGLAAAVWIRKKFHRN